MNIHMVHVVIYVLLIGAAIYCCCIARKKDTGWVAFVQKHLLILVILLLFNTISFGLSLEKQKESYHIDRQPTGGEEREYTFRIDGEEEQSEFAISVEAKRLKPKEAQARMDKAFEYYGEHLKGDNDSLSKITTDIDVSLPYEEYPFDVEIRPQDYSLVDEDGDVRNENKELLAAGYSENEIGAGIPTTIKIILWYGDISREKEYELIIFPREKSPWEMEVESVVSLFERKEKESVYDEGFELPAVYNGMDIHFLSKGGVSPAAVLVMGIVIAGLLLLREWEDKKRAEDLRQQELLMAYPWFINELVLLLGAGMQIKNIFSMLIRDYERRAGDEGDYRRSLIEELKSAVKSFDIGMSEGRIYYELGKRIKLSCYIKVMTLLEQNVTKGSKGLVELLETEERSAMFERMNLAKRRGEEAGTKLLGPMIILLLIIMLMIMIPAFMSFA